MSKHRKRMEKQQKKHQTRLVSPIDREAAVSATGLWWLLNVSEASNVTSRISS